nr:hypothetical protein GCM10020092_097300 [Actinoplanes digitatis]
MTFTAASPMVVGRTVSFAIPFDTAPAGAYAITATVESATDDPEAANNAARASLSVGPIAEVSVLVDAHSAPHVPGSAGSVAVTVADAGPDDAEAPVFTVTLPAEPAPKRSGHASARLDHHGQRLGGSPSGPAG